MNHVDALDEALKWAEAARDDMNRSDSENITEGSFQRLRENSDKSLLRAYRWAVIAQAIKDLDQ